MHTSQKVVNFLRLSVDDGQPGTREHVTEAFKIFEDEIAATQDGNKAVTVAFVDRSVLFLHNNRIGEVQLVVLDPDDTTDALMATVEPNDLISMLNDDPRTGTARDRLIKYLHAALVGKYGAS